MDKHYFLYSQRYYYELIYSPSGSKSFKEQGNLSPNDKRYPYNMLMEKPTRLNGINFSISNSCDYQSSANYLYKITAMCRSPTLKIIHKPELNFIPGIERKFNPTKSYHFFRVSLGMRNTESISVPDVYEVINNNLMLQGKPGSTVELTLHSFNFNGTH